MSLPNVDDLPPGDEPIIVWGTIIKDKTADGLVSLSDPKFLHQRVAVNARTRTRAGIKTLLPNEKIVVINREIIFKVDDPDAWLPIELISFDE